MTKKMKIALIVSGALTLLILGVMDIFLLPAVERAAGGLRCFDLQTFGYDYETARQFLSALSEEGKDLYLRVQLPVDFAFIPAYTCFFLLALWALFRRRITFILPILLAVSDVIENSCTAMMLRDPLCLTPDTAVIFGTVTLCKSILMDLVFVLLLVGLVMLLFKKRRAKTQQQQENEDG